MTAEVAIVGMACRYPDARSVQELWENVVAQRRAFRRMPAERLSLADYYSPRRDDEDRIYSRHAALLTDYEFDRLRFRVAGSSYRSADPAHWLALDMAAAALADAGFGDGEGLPREATGVLVGNSLTGEFSRANLMRLRWPYVRRVLAAALGREGWSEERLAAFLAELEPRYKEPFPASSEESLAGGLSNTIAGRIANHFDLGGGGFTVDGACASSLLAVAQAAQAVAGGDLEVAVVGGVDLSLDPFELVGFARTGALAAGEMRVFDARSSGFVPGEGCGFAVMMRRQEALSQGRRIYAVLRGWGISSDGHGGLTRPEVKGQLLALRRAYRRAGVGIETVACFEAHGTGTAVGDDTELAALSSALAEAPAPAMRAAVGSVKANIGHTKAAAGIAGLIKAVMALSQRLLPPHTGWQEPHPRLAGGASRLRLLDRAEAWPRGAALRAGVSAMGFGGINVHLVLDGVGGAPRRRLTAVEQSLSASPQDAELFLLAAPDADALGAAVAALAEGAGDLSRAELSDLAAHLAQEPSAGRLRAALVAATPEDLAHRLGVLAGWLAEGITARIDGEAGIFLGAAAAAPRIGLLFPGQGSLPRRDGGALARRFPPASAVYEEAELPAGGDPVATENAQPAIAAASLAALRVLERFGVEARLAVGHSLGELVAYHWAGALAAEAVVPLAARRGRAMAVVEGPPGGMASLTLDGAAAAALIAGEEDLVVAAFNAPERTVVSGRREGVERLLRCASERGVKSSRLAVSHAFHSPLMAPAVPALARLFAGAGLGPPAGRVISTVTGAPLAADCDLAALLAQQLTSPVRFVEALAAAAGEVDLWIEVGPGSALGALTRQQTAAPVVSVDAGGSSLRGLLTALGAAFALGVPVAVGELFAGRLVRPIDPGRRPRFLASPCERAPAAPPPVRAAAPPAPAAAPPPPVVAGEASPLETVRALVAARAELPPAAVGDDSRLLADLHLNSIAVSQLVAAAARRLGLDPPASPTDFAAATVGQVAAALEERRDAGGASRESERWPPGVEGWVRAFAVVPQERPAPPPPAEWPGEGGWELVAPPEHSLRSSLERSLAELGGGGVVLCLPSRPAAADLGLFTAAARAVLGERRPGRFVVVQDAGYGGGFARSLFLENPDLATTVVQLPFDHPRAAEWVAAEARAASGYGEAWYDAAGRRRVPALELLGEVAEGERGALPLAAGDVLLVSGGGKGIAAECALALGRASGARLALVGRSRPEDDPELAANLERLAAAGVEARYYPADVTSETAVRRAVAAAESDLGPVTGVLHGAGSNRPRLVTELAESDFRRTLAPKVSGAENLLAAVDPSRLRLWVAFGSVIARAGMRGEADYALANEWLARLTERFAAEHPECRCLCVEWSVWSGVGMGERLGRVESLLAQGITPIPTDRGVTMLLELLARPLPATSVVVSGRLGAAPTLAVARPELPFWRFLERPRVFYPGVELLVEAELSADSDPYLADHDFRGERLFPAVMGLEAMTQAALAVSGRRDLPALEQVAFDRPVALPREGTLTLRLAALCRRPGEVEVVLRSSETAFAADHFRALCRFGGPPPRTAAGAADEAAAAELEIEPQRDLYGGLLFQGQRFQRLAGYRRLRATECRAALAPDGATDWFGRYLPTDLVLGDPGARDAAVHGIQPCVPHATILPVGVERLRPARLDLSRPHTFRARERRRDGGTFIYDLEVMDEEGRLAEHWEGLRLKVVDASPLPARWPAPLLGPYLERRLQELLPESRLEVAIRCRGGARRQAAEACAHELAPGAGVLRHRPDGKPELPGAAAIALAHAGELVLAVSGPAPLGCDAEPVAERGGGSWRDLLGAERWALAELLCREADEEEARSATRVWAAAEGLKKAGVMADAPLTLGPRLGDGWVVLESGSFAAATVIVGVRELAAPLALAVVVRRREGAT